MSNNLIPFARLKTKHSALSVVFVHAIDGGVGSYFDLARKLVGDLNIYGLSAVDVIEKSVPPKNMLELVGLYADQLLSIVIPSSLIIVGWSAGALVGHELACELVRRGSEPNCVMMLDTPAPGAIPEFELPPNAPQRFQSDEAMREMSDWWKFIAIHTSVEGDYLIPAEFWYMNSLQKAEFCIENARSRIFRKDNPFFRMNPDGVKYLFDVACALFSCVSSHRPSSFLGEVITFRAREIALTADERRKLDAEFNQIWATDRKKPVKIIDIIGDHSAPISGAGADHVVNIIADIQRKQLAQRHS